MLFTQAGQDMVLTALRNRDIELKDMAVLMSLVFHCDWRSGRARITQKALAAVMGIQPAHCSAAIKRLQSHKPPMVARVRDNRTGEQFFLINPDLVAVGGAQRRGYLQHQFDEVFGQDDGL